MAVVRRIDAEAMALQRQGELAPVGTAARAGGRPGRARPGPCGRDDFVFPSYREHGVAYCRGVDPVQMLRLWRGAGLSGWDPAEHGIATPAIVVGSQTLHATGYALGLTLDGATSAALTYFGDGASSEGDVAEAFGFAASYVVPVVFFCQNNQWAISEPVRLQSHTSIAQRGQGYGIPGIQVDGNDVLAVLAATRLALARASAGQGPTLIEAVTYRMGPHTTSDDPTRYRSPRRRGGVAGQGPAGPAACAARAPRASPTTRSTRRWPPQADDGGRGAAPGLPGHARPGARRPVRPRLRRAASAPARRSGTTTRPTWPGFDEEA